MYNDDLPSNRSPSGSRAGSYGNGPATRNNVRGYQARSSIVEEAGQDDNEYEGTPNAGDESPRNERPPQRSEDQYIAALRYRFPNRSKNDYSYTKPIGPTVIPTTPSNVSSTNRPTISTSTTPPSGATSTPRSGPYQSSVRPNTGGTNTPDTSEGRTFPRPALRRVSPDQQNAYAKRVVDQTPTTPPAAPPPAPPLPPSIYPSKPATLGHNVRINEPDIERNRSIQSTYNPQSGGPPRLNESIFEKVSSQGGPVSFLGIGTFSQFEHCLRECLERERRQTGISSHITRQDIPAPTSALNYDYDPVPMPSHHGLDPVSMPSHHGLDLVSMPSHHGLDPARVHQFIDYPSRPISTFVLDDIRQINVALSRSGIPLFPYHRSYDESCFSPIFSSRTYPNERHIRGDVVSACQIADEDPAVLSSKNGSQAVQKVWNAIQNHGPFSFMSNVSSRGPYDT